MTVTEAVRQRISTRAFLDELIPKEQLADLLQTAQRAPSGGNLQPWKLIAVTGSVKDEIVAMAQRVLAADPMGGIPGDRPVYPDFNQIDPVYNVRRKRVGEMMYEKVGIPKEDRAARIMWFANNYRFFGAPAAVLVYVHEDLLPLRLVCCGAFMTQLTLAAHAEGLGTCAIGFVRTADRQMREVLSVPEEFSFVVALAVGYPDPQSPVNEFRSSRVPVDEVCRFFD